jgi:tetratricopeptide (TPR) repeat protein
MMANLAQWWPRRVRGPGRVLALLVLLAAPGVTIPRPIAAQSATADLVALGRAVPQVRDPERALAFFTQALALDPENYEANWRAAQALADLGKQYPDEGKNAHRDSLYLAAESLAEVAVRVNPEGADGHYMLAVAVGRTSLTKSSKERVRFAKLIRDETLRAIELDPRHDLAYHVLGRWNAEIMRLSGLTRFFAKTFLGAAIFNEASWDHAVEYLNKAVELGPDNIYHHLDLAQVYIDVRIFSKAREQLEAVGRLPDYDYMDPKYKETAAKLLKDIEGRKDGEDEPAPHPFQ